MGRTRDLGKGALSLCVVQHDVRGLCDDAHFVFAHEPDRLKAVLAFRAALRPGGRSSNGIARHIPDPQP